jgi:menaquinone-dependent protoporphyrinogen IX oxidase
MKISIEHYGIKITIEDAEDIDMHELFQHFKSITLSAGWHESNWNDAVKQYYKEHKLKQNETN